MAAECACIALSKSEPMNAALAEFFIDFDNRWGSRNTLKGKM
jgi:hypothetical protein